jgi:cytoskeletal protein CcmA (bactofilin family)
MFNTNQSNFDALSEVHGHDATSVRTETLPYVPAAAARGMSVLGADLTILGDKITIISQSKLQVDGQITGDIHGKEVVINTESSVSGEVWAERVDVRGEVHGSIIAVTVVLHESARVAGNIMHQKLSVSEGAEFDGCVHLIRDPSELIPILDAEALVRGRKRRDGAPSGSDWLTPRRIPEVIEAA